ASGREYRDREREPERRGRLRGERAVVRRGGGERPARRGDERPVERPRDEPREDDEGGERDPLPEADLQEAHLEERRGQQVRGRPPAVLRIEGRDRGDGGRGELPERRAGRLRDALDQDLDRPGRRLDRPDGVAERGKPVVGIAFRLVAQPLEVDQERAIEDGLELARELGAALGADRSWQLAEVQVLGGPGVLAVVGGGEETGDGAARHLGTELARGAGRLGRRRGGRLRRRAGGRGERQEDRGAQGPETCPLGGRRTPTRRSPASMSTVRRIRRQIDPVAALRIRERHGARRLAVPWV